MNNKNLMSKEFFHSYANRLRSEDFSLYNKNSFFDHYTNDGILMRMKWLVSNVSYQHKRIKILDFGCGLGRSTLLLDLVVRNADITGVDVSKESIEFARKVVKNWRANNHFEFISIDGNRLPFPDEYFDAVQEIHVLHHSKSYRYILQEIYRVLKKKGKLLICDLTSNNPFINLGRASFRFVPKFIQEKFSDDLVVGGKIPPKYKINLENLKRDLEKIGFEIIAEANLHLFLFIFWWFMKVFPKTEKVAPKELLTKLLKVEKQMLNHSFFKRMSSMFILQCVKTKG